MIAYQEISGIVIKYVKRMSKKYELDTELD